MIGRFLTADTVVPNHFNPQRLNRYSYCRNNPLIYVDPTGHYDYGADVSSGMTGPEQGIEVDIDGYGGGGGESGDQVGERMRQIFSSIMEDCANELKQNQTYAERLRTMQRYVEAKSRLNGIQKRDKPPEIEKTLELSSSYLGFKQSTTLIDKNGKKWGDTTTRVSPTATYLGFSFDFKGRLSDWTNIDFLGDTTISLGQSSHLSVSVTPGTGEFGMSLGWGFGSPVDVNKTIDTIDHSNY